jgi:hypothetical protein
MEQLRRAISLWEASPQAMPRLARSFTAAEQSAREAELETFVSCLQSEVERVPQTRPERDGARERITASFVRFARTALDFSDAQMALLLEGGFSNIGTELARRARHFSAGISTADVFQASRNAWTACGLQVLFGKPLRLTPAIFAYSLLYPYTDNYLDDPRADREAKAGFSARFRGRLKGDPVPAANPREADIWRLVGMIEGEFPRREHAGVFSSLLAIHRAQEESLRLVRGGCSGDDLVWLSFAKGGTSVEADAWLAAGSPTAAQAQAAFDWGVLLQLSDDLQDVRQDLDDGVTTLFSAAAGRAPLDALTNRTLNFAAPVIAGLAGIAGPGCGPLLDLIAKSSASLLVRAAGEACDLYSPAYVAELERHSPFRFAFLRMQRKRLEKRSGLLVRLFEAFLEGEDDEPAFPFLPSSLMPRF